MRQSSKLCAPQPQTKKRPLLIARPNITLFGLTCCPYLMPAKGATRLYADFLQSDVPVAPLRSPPGVRCGCMQTFCSLTSLWPRSSGLPHCWDAWPNFTLCGLTRCPCSIPARGAVRLYADFLQSDIIVASPIGLATLLEEEDAGPSSADFLSSIEVCLLERADVLQMQNWAHVLGGTIPSSWVTQL